MAVSASVIRAGRGEVELGLNSSALQSGLNSAQAKLQAFAGNVARIGMSMISSSMMAFQAFMPAESIFANYEQELANLRAAANPTADVFINARNSIENIARSTGATPQDVAKAFTELVKAGIPLEGVISDIGLAAIQFGRISGMDMAQTSIILADAMNVFRRDGLSAANVATILNQAADSSSVSLRDMAESLGTAGSVLGMYNQSLRDTTIAIGILGNAGIKGAEAGTALKTFFMRIAAGTDGADEAMAQMGLNVRDASGHMLPMYEILRRINLATRDMTAPDQIRQRDRLFAQLAGYRGIRALTTLVSAGTEGWIAFSDRMQNSLTVEQKFAIMTDTLIGHFRRLVSGVHLAAIAIGEAINPAVRGLGSFLIPVLKLIELWAKSNPDLLITVAALTAGMLALGVAFVAFGWAVSGSLFILTILSGVAQYVMLPLLAFLLVARNFPSFRNMFSGSGESARNSVADIRTAFRGMFEMFAEIGNTFRETWRSIVAAIMVGDLSAAARIAWLGVQLAFEQGASYSDNVSIGMVGTFIEWWGRAVRWFVNMWATVSQTIVVAMENAIGGITGMWVQFFSWIEMQWERVTLAAELIRLQALQTVAPDAAREQRIGEIRFQLVNQEANRQLVIAAAAREFDAMRITPAQHAAARNQFIRFFNELLGPGNLAGAADAALNANRPGQPNARERALREQIAQEEAAIEVIRRDQEMQAFLDEREAWRNQNGLGQQGPFGDGENAGVKITNLGAFSSDVAKGFLGAGADTPQERANRFLQGQLAVANQQLEELRRLVRLAGGQLLWL